MSGRYVKIIPSSTWGGPWMQAALQVCGTDGLKWNDPTMAHTVNQTSGGDPSYLSDTEYGDFWYGNLANGWWKVDLRVRRYIPIIKVKGGLMPHISIGTCRISTVWVSDDNSNWIQILSATTAHDTTLQSFNTTDICAQDPLNYLHARRDRMNMKNRLGTKQSVETVKWLLQ